MTEKMKPSGIAWIGDVPRSWKCKKLKYLISEPLQYGANEEGCDFEETYPRYIRITDIEDNNQLKSDGKQSLLPSVAVQYILNDGDVLFARSGATVGKTFIYSSEVGCAAFAGYLIRASVDKKQILPKYLYYCTINGGYDNWKNSVFTQATIQNIGADKYAQFSIAFPSITEQQCIADFLDIQCAKIDSIAADLEKQIELLQKYKKSLITETVTKGLDKSIPMKDSGIKWIGEIPCTWDINRLRYAAAIKTGPFGTQLSADEYTPEGVPIINVKNIGYGSILSDDLDYIPESVADRLSEHRLRENDIVFGRKGAVDKHAIISKQCENWVQGSDCIRVRCDNSFDARYLNYLFDSTYFRSHVLLYAVGATMPSMSSEILLNAKVLVPPIEEQARIADSLDLKCSAITAVISGKTSELERINNHKKSLIYEYVTGKKRVKEAQ